MDVSKKHHITIWIISVSMTLYSVPLLLTFSNFCLRNNLMFLRRHKLQIHLVILFYNHITQGWVMSIREMTVFSNRNLHSIVIFGPHLLKQVDIWWQYMRSFLCFVFSLSPAGKNGDKSSPIRGVQEIVDENVERSVNHAEEKCNPSRDEEDDAV